MKTFKSYLKEVSSMTLDQGGSAMDQDMNRGDYSDPKVIVALDRFVGAIARNYTIPESAVITLRSSLSKIGLTFGEVPMMEGESGSFDLPLTSFGGRFGKGIDTPHDQFESDDGISNQREGGLKLVLSYAKQEDNSCRLNASIK
tara:strand:- start:668 stop:1099 length:432 start_codon:yes stop_codon:yes gene_type:complete